MMNAIVKFDLSEQNLGVFIDISFDATKLTDEQIVRTAWKKLKKLVLNFSNAIIDEIVLMPKWKFFQ